MVTLKERKTRSDKKRDVKPTVPIALYDTVSRISHITNTPMKDVAEMFCINGLLSIKVIESLRDHFRRTYTFSATGFPTIFPGDEQKIGQRIVKEVGLKRRLTIRFTQDIYDQLSELAYALDMTVSSATALLLKASIQETDILNQYLQTYINQNLDRNRKEQLKEVLHYVNLARNNPYENEFTLRALLSFVFDEAWEYGKSFKKLLEEWLDNKTEYVEKK